MKKCFLFKREEQKGLWEVYISCGTLKISTGKAKHPTGKLKLRREAGKLNGKE